MSTKRGDVYQNPLWGSSTHQHILKIWGPLTSLWSKLRIPWLPPWCYWTATVPLSSEVWDSEIWSTQIGFLIAHLVEM
jgi:hypothetical protein